MHSVVISVILRICLNDKEIIFSVITNHSKLSFSYRLNELFGSLGFMAYQPLMGYFMPNLVYGLVWLFNGISTFIGYLMPKPVLFNP